MKNLIYLLCVASLVACSGNSSVNRALSFNSEVKNVREEYGFPGMTAAYKWSDGTGHAAYSGLADIEKQVPIEDFPRMPGASTGKSFVAALTILLSMEDRLGLDEKVSKWLAKKDWFIRLPNHKSITIRHLLTHSAGLPDHVHMKTFQEAFIKERKQSQNTFPPARLIKFIMDKPALFEAGEGWSYTDTGYILLGLVIEEVTGRDIYTEIQQRLIRPMELRDTSPANMRKIDRLAAGYMNPVNPFDLPPKTLDTDGMLQWHPGVEWTGGGLVTTSYDLARWAEALFSGKVMAEMYIGEVLNSVPVMQGVPTKRYGAGIVIDIASDGTSVYGHSGWLPGYISSFKYYPQHGLSVAFQVNTDKGIFDNEKNIIQLIDQRLFKALNSTSKQEQDIPGI